MKILFLGHAFLPLVLIFTTASTHPTWRLVVLYFAWFVDCCFVAGVLVVQQTFFSSSLSRRALPMVRHITDPRLRKTIRRELRHRDRSVRKNAVEKIRTVSKKAA